MKFSLFFNFDILPGTTAPSVLRHVEEQVILADELGYDGIWLAEHHFQEYGKMPSPLLFLARLSALTKRIMLGTAVVEAPYYHPLRLAEDASLLDRLSGGRLRLGIGSGAGNKAGEFTRFGIPLDEKGPRQIEIGEILLQALSTGRVDYEGTYHRHRDVQIEPLPLQPVRDLVAVAAGTTGTPFAAAHDLALLLPRAAPDARVREMVSNYRAGLSDGGSGRVVPLWFTFVAESEGAAHAATRAAFFRYAKYDANIDWDGRTETPEFEMLCQRIKFAVGTPDQVAARIDEWIDDLQPAEIMGQMFVAGVKHEDAMRSMHLFAEEVMPRFR